MQVTPGQATWSVPDTTSYCRGWWRQFVWHVRVSTVPQPKESYIKISRGLSELWILISRLQTRDGLRSAMLGLISRSSLATEVNIFLSCRIRILWRLFMLGLDLEVAGIWIYPNTSACCSCGLRGFMPAMFQLRVARNLSLTHQVGGTHSGIVLSVSWLLKENRFIKIWNKPNDVSFSLNKCQKTIVTGIYYWTYHVLHFLFNISLAYREKINMVAYKKDLSIAVWSHSISSDMTFQFLHNVKQALQLPICL